MAILEYKAIYKKVKNMDLSDFMEEDLSEYIDSTLSGDPDYQLMKEREGTERKFVKALKDGLKSLKKIEKKITSAENAIAEKNIEAAYSYCRKAAKELEGLSCRIGFLPARFGEKRKEEKNSSVVSVSRDAIFEYWDNGIIHIILPELLPKRLKFNSATGEYENTYGQAMFKSKYQDTFYKEYQMGKRRIYSKKVILFTVNYYVADMAMNDIDNLDGKAFQDLVSTLYLLDDDPARCAIMSECLIGHYAHTETYVVPVEIFPGFLQSFYEGNQKV